MSDQQQTLSIPSLILFAALSALAIRYFFFSPSSTSANGTPRNSRTANPAHVEQIAQMFPQISRRDIMWDLQRNGGSVAATTERILSRGSLDTVSIKISTSDKAWNICTAWITIHLYVSFGLLANIFILYFTATSNISASDSHRLCTGGLANASDPKAPRTN